MTTSTNRYCCIKDCKIRPTTTCLGCSEVLYCGPHHKQHRDDLHAELLQVADNCNQFLEEIKVLIHNPQKHALMKNIDEWETQSIAKIRQMAKESREEVLPYVKNFIPRVETKLASLNAEVRQNLDDCDFMDTDIENSTKELQRLKAILNDPPDFTVQQDPTEFINKIYLKVEEKIMPRNAGASKQAGKDPNAPKRPLSAFFIFSQDERPDIKKKSPSLSVGDIAKEIGLRWKNVSDDVKKRYEQKAAVEIQKYEVRLAEYKKSGGVSSARGDKAAAKASESKIPASKSKSSDENSDDDDDEDSDEDEGRIN
ncbi:unnamed protein product [Rotaria magnacalcarata]|uniref:HMG box domain-containing protein n=3 Tax=Rotaria magnacalcarata TaxID=392030 RepID=A0A814U350_9BILA|nr:unnamed protein product [Rotaria magnacalcarata]CAF1441994.1 unnamed protein product [Rotaria magnacalcarata]